MTDTAENQITAEQTLRLHALNIAGAVHKDEIRFVRDETNRPDVAGMVLVTAVKFHAWLVDGSVA